MMSASQASRRLRSERNPKVASAARVRAGLAVLSAAERSRIPARPMRSVSAAMGAKARPVPPRAQVPLDLGAEHLDGHVGDLGRVAADAHALRLERLGLCLGGSARTADDRA